MGVCDVAGTASTTAGGNATQFPWSPAQSQAVDIGSSELVREVRDGAQPSACVESLQSSPSVTVSVHRGIVRVSPTDAGTGLDPEDGALLAPTRCAAPLPAELDGLLPSATVRLSDLRHGVTVPMTASRGFSAGPFSGALHSTVRLTLRLVRGALPGGAQLPATIRSSVRPVASLRRTFTVTSGADSLVSTFVGPPAPGCAAFAACGVTGTSTLAQVSGRVTIAGSGPWEGRGRPTRAAVLRAFEDGELPVGLAGSPRRS